MSWTAIENFNTYSDGNLATNNGGTGWAGAWTAVTGTGPQVQGTTVFEGAKAVSLSEADAVSERQLTTGVTSGIVHVAIRKSSVAAGSITFAFTLRSASGSANDQVRLLFDADAGISLVGNTTEVLSASPNANQWYEVDIEIDQANSRFRARLDGGTYSTYVADIGNNGFTSITHVVLAQSTSTTGTAFWDDIRSGEGSPSLSPSTSLSPSASASASASKSASASLSPSASESASASRSASRSASASASQSLSPSASESKSASKSASASMSASESASESMSASASLSPSASSSASASASASASGSRSASPSLSPSASLSQSASASASPSPAEYVNKYSTVGNTYTDKYSTTL
ncbi:MAG: hypothetical protein NUV69_00515 [Candidatus Curtissbacteria bacterium]|nr:hypothetical protein [Candidatus Curtissbacteria bacterium]